MKTMTKVLGILTTASILAAGVPAVAAQKGAAPTTTPSAPAAPANGNTGARRATPGFTLTPTLPRGEAGDQGMPDTRRLAAPRDPRMVLPDSIANRINEVAAANVAREMQQLRDLMDLANGGAAGGIFNGSDPSQLDELNKRFRRGGGERSDEHLLGGGAPSTYDTLKRRIHGDDSSDNDDPLAVVERARGRASQDGGGAAGYQGGDTDDSDKMIDTSSRRDSADGRTTYENTTYTDGSREARTTERNDDGSTDERIMRWDAEGRPSQEAYNHTDPDRNRNSRTVIDRWADGTEYRTDTNANGDTKTSWTRRTHDPAPDDAGRPSHSEAVRQARVCANHWEPGCGSGRNDSDPIGPRQVNPGHSETAPGPIPTRHLRNPMGAVVNCGDGNVDACGSHLVGGGEGGRPNDAWHNTADPGNPNR